MFDAGWRYYTWDEWKKYYRKMKGLPEDGLKRIKFEGKRKERKIDWGDRFALTPEELNKHGIQMSKTGPVMIPIQNALNISNELLKGAKSIYTIRDGLEVMRAGLDSETEKLSKRKYLNVNVYQTVANEGGETEVQQP